MILVSAILIPSLNVSVQECCVDIATDASSFWENAIVIKTMCSD